MSRDILHAQLRTGRSTLAERGQERQVAVQVGRRFGFDLRPSRFFAWADPERQGRERIVSLGKPPARMQAPRRRRWQPGRDGTSERLAQHARKRRSDAQKPAAEKPGETT
jgi:hypothetical protein